MKQKIMKLTQKQLAQIYKNQCNTDSTPTEFIITIMLDGVEYMNVLFVRTIIKDYEKQIKELEEKLKRYEKCEQFQFFGEYVDFVNSKTK
ncbi:hypothetical protein KC678_05880 [Candidatus Dojkabacteria bacterium]|uniref:Uncharacterized protein n=1 Tax=Candidatus Dojkabacteria bacterium TaxID=2099670 RepID=A0A955L2L7_9BACT|nr:hypothetical protein [Candidatus Dojkabacteria bacterium]